MRAKWQQELFDYLKECEDHGDNPVVSPEEIKFLYHEILRLEKILGMVKPEPVVPAGEHLPPVQDEFVVQQVGQFLADRQWQKVLVDGRRR